MTKKQLITLSAIVLIALSGCSEKKAPSPEGTQVSNKTETIGDGVVDINTFDGKSRSGFNSIYFPLDGYTLNSHQHQRLLRDIAAIKQKSSGKRLRIEGNCDDFGTNEYNHALGLKRANAVRKVLIAEGIPASKIITVSNGESNPVCKEAVERCYARNRRADVNVVQ